MRNLILGFILSIAMFSANIFSADYFNQDEWIIPTGMNAGIVLNSNFADDFSNLSDPTFGMGLNLSYRMSVSLGFYMDLSTKFSGSDSYPLNADLGATFYIVPETKIQPLVSAGVTLRNLFDDSQSKGLFLGVGGEYVIDRKMTVPFKLQYNKNLDVDYSDITFKLGFNYYF